MDEKIEQKTNSYQPEDYYRFFELPLDRWNFFNSPNLRKSKVVMSKDFVPIVDFFNSHGVGVGGRTAEQSASELNLDENDRKLLEAILNLYSYDVYTLRASLSKILRPDVFDVLKLPDGEQRMLEQYIKSYTRALFSQIFEDEVEANDRTTMRAVLEGSSSAIVQRNVLFLANKFSINKLELVNYLAGVGDMLLAIAFYKKAFEENKHWMQSFLIDIKRLNGNRILCVRHPDLQKMTLSVLTIGTRTIRKLQTFFESFEGIGTIWSDLTPDKFRVLRDRVERQYPVVGTILCLWQVKIAAWNQRFNEGKRKIKEAPPEQLAMFFEEQVYPGLEEKISSYTDLLENFEGEKI